MKRNEKPPADPELTRRIQELIKSKGGGHNESEVADIIENALKMLTDVKDKGDVRVIQTAVRELRYAFRIFAPYHQKRKVTIFGSARTKPESIEYQQAVEFGAKIVKAGYMVITGAGPGIMQAGHEGATPEHSFGVNIRLPWEQSANPVIAEDKKLLTFNYFFTRKLIFIRHSDAIVLFPGGFGTMDELFEILELSQTRKMPPVPVILVGEAYWRRAFDADFLVEEGVIDAEDRELFWFAESAESIWSGILKWHDMQGTPLLAQKGTPL